MAHNVPANDAFGKGTNLKITVLFHVIFVTLISRNEARRGILSLVDRALTAQCPVLQVSKSSLFR